MIVLGLAAAVLVAVVIEITCRISLRYLLRRYSNMPNSRTVYSVHEDLRAWLPAEVDYAVNREGERGNPLPKVKSLYRVLLAGGSAAECTLLPWEDSIGGHLDALLNAPDARAQLGTEAAHVGVVAHSQLDAHGIAFILKNILPGYRSLDTVLLLSGLSDALLWLEAGAPSGAAAPSLDKSAEWLLNYPEMRFRTKKPAALVLLQLVWIYCFGRTVRHTGAGRYATKELKSRLSAPSPISIDSDPTVMVQTYKQNLRAAIDTARRYARRVILIEQYWFDRLDRPSQDQILSWSGRLGDPRAPGPAKFIQRAEMLELFRLVGKATLETADECGLECVSLEGNIEPRAGIFYDDLHFAPEGGRQIAEVIAKTILSPASIKR